MPRKKKVNRSRNERKVMRPIVPLTPNQHALFDAWYDGFDILAHGWAGTGKTFLSMYLSLKELTEPVYEEGVDPYEKLYIIRSAVPARDIGFMPGSLEEKIAIYEAPYRAISNDLLERPDGYEDLKKHGIIEFISTSYARGLTFTNAIILADEIQNMDWGELATIITRVGKNCRLIFCGDISQSDFRGHESRNKDDVLAFMGVLKKMEEDFDIVEFNSNDIVRSDIVKRFIVEANKIGRGLS